MENCLLLKLYRKLRKMFLSPRRESNPQTVANSFPLILSSKQFSFNLPSCKSSSYIYELLNVYLKVL